MEWFECKISDVASNLLQWLIFLSIKGQGALDHRGGELMVENFMVGQIFEKLVEEEGDTCIMDGRRQSKSSSPNWKLWCVINSKHNKCAPIVRWKQLGWL
jgi:hypothetical protein